MLNCYSQTLENPTPIIPIIHDQFQRWLLQQSKRMQNLVVLNKFKASPNTFCLIPNSEGELEQVLLGVANTSDFLSFGVLANTLPQGVYQIEAVGWESNLLQKAVLGWGLGSYRFNKYKAQENQNNPKLCIPVECDFRKIQIILDAIFLVRDLINTPAEDMTPNHLAEVALGIAKKFGAKINQIVGEELLQQNFAAIYTVGRGSVNLPRLIELRWGEVNAPKVTLVGKGVCFDSGGLDIKSPLSIILMKKDMAGAAHALGLAQMLMALNVKINLRVLLPTVENLISGSSYKPGDIIKSRNGLTIEVRDTDAEGRLILADALAFASEEKPELLIDFATLTGAARMALGMDIAALFTENDQLAEVLTQALANEEEYTWRLPLFNNYREYLRSKIADISSLANTSVVGGGAIMAALFLQKFVGKSIPWVHFDFGAYNYINRPGRPEGGEAMCLRGILNYLLERFGSQS